MKPYDFVPLLGAKDYKKQGKLLSGVLKLRVEVLTPLHIYSGFFDIQEGQIYKSFTKYKGQYIIPGSSFKGCVRTIAEAVSESCISTKQRRDMFEVNISDNGRCIVCDMFGSMGHKGKLRFMDLKLVKSNGVIIKKLPAFFPPHPESESYKKDDKFKGIKFYYHGNEDIIETGEIPHEVVIPGSIFEGDVFYEGIDEKQLDLLCFSLGLGENISLKLGYGKPGYYGSVKVRTLDDRIKAKERAMRYGRDNKKIRDNIAALEKILDWNRRHVESVWFVRGSQRTY